MVPTPRPPARLHARGRGWRPPAPARWFPGRGPPARPPAPLTARVRVVRPFFATWSYRHWPLTVTPDCTVECASQLRPPKVGEVTKALREEKPDARSCAAPRS